MILTGGLHVESASAAGSAMPEAPLPGYTPRFVTQTDERPPWEDCLWASGVMLLDKWTHGHLHPDRQRLRAASRDFRAGSAFADLARAVSRLYGWRPRWSPDGGDQLTWRELLSRLAAGGGAVIAGDYGDLGNPFIRWARSYAANPRAAGHAMYVERYDAARDRMWLMDPLGRDGYRGEWVPARRIYAFIWRRRGHVFALATPAPPARSASGYMPGPLALAAGPHLIGETVALTLPFTRKGPWPLPELQVATSWEVVAPDGWAAPPAAPTTSSASSSGALSRSALIVSTEVAALLDDGLASGQATLPSSAPLPSSATLASQVALPTLPGLWRLSAAIERRDGRDLPDTWQQAPIEVRVWGDRGAVVVPVAPATESVSAGGPVQLTVMIVNAGRLPWSAAPLGPRLGEEGLDAPTQLVVIWASADGALAPARPPMTLTASSAAQLAVSLALVAPTLPGSYQLRFDVRDGQGSLVAPEVALVELPVVVDPAPTPPLGPTAAP